MMSRIEMGALHEGAQRTVEVEVKELGGTVLLRSITRAELNEIRVECGSPGELDIERMDVLILLAAWLEPSLDDEDDPEALLRGQPAGLINDLTKKALEVSGLTKTARFLSGTGDDDRPGPTV